MRTHEQIDERSLAMARAIVAKIDQDPMRAGLAKARATCRRWHQERPQPAIKEWLEILDRPWEQVRAVLLDESEEKQRASVEMEVDQNHRSGTGSSSLAFSSRHSLKNLLPSSPV